MTDNTSVTAQFGAGERGDPIERVAKVLEDHFWRDDRDGTDDGQRLYIWTAARLAIEAMLLVAPAAPVSHTSVKDGGGDAVAATPSKSKFDETGLSKHLREIIGQETTPPLWIYVTKEQIPILATIADRLDWLESLYAPFITDHPPQPAVHAPAQAPEQPTGSDAVADGARVALAQRALEAAAARFNLMAGVGRINGADPKVGHRECMEAIAALRSAPVKAAPSINENWSCAADFLDDIEVDANGMCRWADVANAQTHIRHSLRSVQPPAPVKAVGSEALPISAKDAIDIMNGYLTVYARYDGTFEIRGAKKAAEAIELVARHNVAALAHPGSGDAEPGAVMGKPRVVGHTELCLFLLPFLQQGDFTVEALVTAILADFQVIDRAALRSAPVKAVGSEALRDLLREARQYVSDAGVDDDPETKRNSSSLLSAIDTALAHPESWALREVRSAISEIKTIALAGWSNHYDQDFGTKDDDYRYDCIREQASRALAALAHPGSGDAEPGAWRSALHLAREYISQDHGGYKEGDGYWEQTRDLLAEINSALATPQAPAQTLQHHTGDGE